MRMNDVKESGAELVAVGCPQCTAMLEGVVDATAEVRDIAELVADALVERPTDPALEAARRSATTTPAEEVTV
jgi:hypothetical protein